jgi:hypothetical protein
MNTQLFIQDNNTDALNDVSELVGDISVETHLAEQPGKLTFKFIKSEQSTAFFYEGSLVYLIDSDKSRGIFWGYVFKKSRDRNQIITVTAYDQLRYLKNKDTYTLKGMTSSDIFAKICTDFNLEYRVTDASTFVIADTAHDNKALAAMIEDALDKTLAYTGKRYMIRDDYGTLEHIDLERLRTTLVVGDAALLLDYSYESSIDGETHNQVKLVQENKTTHKRDTYVVRDVGNIAKWGILQYHEKLDEGANAAQIEARADMLLKLHNTVYRALTLECLGDFDVSAGTGLMLCIKDLGDINLNQYCIVQSCRHSLKNDLHTMSLGVEIWRAPK